MTVNICDSSVLCADKAVKALDKYTRKLEKRKVEGLTEKQTYALIKTVKVLRTAIVQSKNFSDCVYIISPRSTSACANSSQTADQKKGNEIEGVYVSFKTGIS